MEQNKPELPKAGDTETYTPGQKIILKVLKWGARIVSAVAIAYVMHY
ncbi:hypothetical protein [Sporomusa malonica]|uniref:Uncharacterized protein n=1 Tax=Sporomusa malonica TaxID=112901 RepID=A0A1W1Z7J9_9FIRM|nr:hypothetical protein [Sporomusa malonica]SMC44364.1 hypothetical protein SAMN04488500_10363 [Sporomusa malonica]